VSAFHPSPALVPGMEFRSSVSWFDTSSSQRAYRATPFVSKSGKFSLNTLCIWKCYPQQQIFSLVSTVYSRLRAILIKRFKKELGKRLLNCAFKIAIVYVLTRDNRAIDRFLGMTRRKARTPIKVVEALCTSCVYALSENKRFVYSQAYFQANWLKFQVFRPSDKLSKDFSPGTHLSNLYLRSVAPWEDKVIWKSSPFHSSVYDLWKVEKSLRYRAKAHYSNSSSSGFAFDLSELNSFVRAPEDFSFSSSDEEDY